MLFFCAGPYLRQPLFEIGAERKSNIMPMTIQTCTSAHVYPSEKHAVFRKTDAQL
jgi:hypothetical protein